MATIIIQARLGSKRFPRKVLKSINGKWMINWVIDAALGTGLNTILVTPDKELSKLVSIPVSLWEGKRDVLGEFWNAAKDLNCPIIRITGDCPMLTSNIIDKVYNFYLQSDADYVYNTHDSSPLNDGIDVEVFSFESLKEAYQRADTDYDREHVTPYIRRNFDIELCPMNYGETLSVNTYEDYKKVCLLMEK